MVKTVYIVAGPTAVGKTAISIDLAKKLNTAVISADSRQCYKEMTIGTAKPGAEELQSVRHYFIDDYSVVNNITAADFENLALDWLEEIFKEQDTAVVCGGTGLYIKALCEGLDEMPAINQEIVEDINQQYETQGINWLRQAVKEEDPEFYAVGEIQNPARLLRALTFKRSIGESIVHFKTGKKKERDFKIVKIGLELPREVLYRRIDARVDTMIQNGLLDEVKGLYALRKLKNLQTVGYSELFDYIDGQLSLDEAIEKIKQHTRNYAKRQMTWFKKDKEIIWFNAEDANLIDKILTIT
ncbi:MAG: tRNA (adenosine(37)-N6)-dimethylallyltransferase MiaA [Bacteroidetes bacterium]|nr:tRNA (adenosine(37)-N6)-dimethylallyltransferase MiaA [Bacteroidota bacterium]